MDKFDPRRLRIHIEIAGKMHIYEGLNMEASGTKTSNSDANNCEITLFNLKKEIRNHLLTHASPFINHKQRKRIIIEAGRETTGVTRIFVGDIVTVRQSQPPDIALFITAQTGNYTKGKLISYSGKGVEKLSSLAKIIAKDAGLRLDFQASDKSIAHYSFTGSAIKQVEKLNEIGDIEAFVDDDVLIVKNKGEPRKKPVRILSQESGMIGTPRITEHGIRVKFLFDQQTFLGSLLQLNSPANPVLNGIYEIYKLSFHLSMREKDWYYEAEAERL